MAEHVMYVQERPGLLRRQQAKSASQAYHRVAYLAEQGSNLHLKRPGCRRCMPTAAANCESPVRHHVAHQVGLSFFIIVILIISQAAAACATPVLAAVIMCSAWDVCLVTRCPLCSPTPLAHLTKNHSGPKAWSSSSPCGSHSPDL